MATEHLQELRAGFVEKVESLVGQATKTPAGGGSDWAGVLHEYGIAPTASSGVQSAVACGFQPTQGALPLELRKVLMAVRADFERRAVSLAKRLESEGAPDNVLHQLGKFPAVMDAIVDERMTAYVESIRPKTTLGGIFANAAASSLRSGQVESGNTTLKCRCCGAARPVGTDMRECAFCGTPLFNDRPSGDENER